MDTVNCALCDHRPALMRKGICLEHCKECHELLTADRLTEEAEAMEKDGILTEEDVLHGSNTGC